MRSADRLRQVAIERFAAQGFQATGIRDLAKHTGLSVASLYQHMPTKHDLLVEIMSDSLRRLIDDSDVVLALIPHPLDRIAGLTMLHVLAHGLRRDRTVVVDTEVRSLEPHARAEVIALRDEYEQRWRDTLHQAAQAGAIADDHLDIARLAILEMLTGVATWYQPAGPSSLETIARTHVDLVLAMLDAHKGRRRVRFAQCDLPDAQWFDDLLSGVD